MDFCTFHLTTFKSLFNLFSIFTFIRDLLEVNLQIPFCWCFDICRIQFLFQKFTMFLVRIIKDILIKSLAFILFFYFLLFFASCIFHQFFFSNFSFITIPSSLFIFFFCTRVRFVNYGITSQYPTELWVKDELIYQRISLILGIRYIKMNELFSMSRIFKFKNLAKSCSCRANVWNKGLF